MSVPPAVSVSTTVRYYACTAIGLSAQAQGCTLPTGVLITPWRQIGQLLPGNKLLGSGVWIKRLDTLQEAAAHVLLKCRQPRYGTVDSVPVFDCDFIAEVCNGIRAFPDRGVRP